MEKNYFDCKNNNRIALIVFNKIHLLLMVLFFGLCSNVVNAQCTVNNNYLTFSNGSSGQINATASEGNNAVLNAPPNGTYFATVNFASYGTPTGNSPNFAINAACHSSTSQSVTEGYLLRTSAVTTIPATNSVFGDPCSGTVKRLNVLATYAHPLCSGNTATIIGSTPTGGNGNYTYRWESSTTSATTGFTTAAGTSNGRDYAVIVSQTTWFRRIVTSCNPTISTSAVVMITVNPSPSSSNAGPDQSASNTPFRLAANNPAVGTGVWSIVSGPNTALTQFSSTTNREAIFTPTVAGNYLLNWTISNNNCVSTVDQVIITNNCVDNLIKNGDFREGVANWTQATIPVTDRVEVNTEGTYFSNSSASLTAELDKEASLRQVVTVMPNVPYTVSFRYAGRPGAPNPTGVTVRITGGTTIESFNFPSNNTTTPRVGSFTFTPTSSSIGVEFYNTISETLGTIIDDIVLLPTSQASQGVPYAVTNPRGNFNTTTACAGVAVQLDVENAPASGVTYVWTGSAGAVFSSSSIKNPTVKFTNSGLQQTATVTVTTAAGCSTSSTTYFNVGVTPTITAPVATSVCSGDTYSSGAITSTGMTYDWSRAAIVGINGGAANPGGTNNNATGFTEVLTNATSSPINVTYVLTPKSTATTCAGIAYNLVITVNPKPVAPTGTPVQPTCSVLTGSIVLNGLPATGTIVQKLGAATATNVSITGGGFQEITNLNPGNYTFAVSNGRCGSTTLNITINNPPALVTWNGTDWSSAPTIENRVEFNASYSSGSTVKAIPNVEACSCYVKNNANVVFNSGHTLKVVNEVVVNTDPGTTAKLTFEDKASLVQINDLANNAGVITYKRITAAVNRYDYTYWSSPVADMTLNKLSSKTFFDKYFSYDNGWVVSKNGVAPMLAGNGYIIRAPQTTAISGNPLPFPASFEGTPNNGVITKALKGHGTYLLGNPYPSAMSADAFLTKNVDKLEGTLYFWTHNTAPAAASGTTSYKYAASDYASYNRTGGVGSVPKALAAISGGNAPTGSIAAGQGFFAPAKASAIGDIVFNNAMRLSSNKAVLDNSQFFKLSASSKTTPAVATTEKSRIWLNLTNSEGAFKQMLVGYIVGATNEYDSGFDGMTYDGNQFVDFYSVNQDKNLSIQGRALPFVKKDSVALGYKSAIKGDFQISVDQTDGDLATQNIFLEDKDLKIVHNLKKEAYTFSTEKGAFNTRFVLRYVDKNAVEEIKPEIPQVLNKEVLVSVKDRAITVNSAIGLLDNVIIYDNSGRKMFQKNKIANTIFVIPQLISSNQVLVVDVVLANGKKVSRKIVY